ncbi:hypothetical protein C8J57DRAFT_1472860 [Mycena rebaudengoi]|nr:hypothetical protein C8J57DRAFT_1472860 [Mycena rebaudengoi]
MDTAGGDGACEVEQLRCIVDVGGGRRCREGADGEASTWRRCCAAPPRRDGCREPGGAGRRNRVLSVPNAEEMGVEETPRGGGGRGRRLRDGHANTLADKLQRYTCAPPSSPHPRAAHAQGMHAERDSSMTVTHTIAARAAAHARYPGANPHSHADTPPPSERALIRPASHAQDGRRIRGTHSSACSAGGVTRHSPSQKTRKNAKKKGEEQRREEEEEEGGGRRREDEDEDEDEDEGVEEGGGSTKRCMRLERTRTEGLNSRYTPNAEPNLHPNTKTRLRRWNAPQTRCLSRAQYTCS